MSVSEFLIRLMKYAIQQSEGVSVVELLILWLIGTLIMHLFILLTTRITGSSFSLKQEILGSLIILYVSFVSQITILRRASGSHSEVYLDLFIGSLTEGFLATQQLFYSILNVLLFIPWGILLGLHRRNTSTPIRVIMVTCYSFLTSIFIESLQYITKRGHFEISDMVTNTMGGFIGALIASVLIVIYTKGRRQAHERQQG